MEETDENWHCHNETNEARLRGAMSPMFGLPSAVLMIEELDEGENKERLRNIVLNQAKQANENAPEVKELLLTIESANEKRVIQAQIDILKEHIKHPNKPGYKRSDILDKIKKLESNLLKLNV
jgi:uncharacterized protein (UPF0147 family)